MQEGTIFFTLFFSKMRYSAGFLCLRKRGNRNVTYFLIYIPKVILLKTYFEQIFLKIKC